MNPLAFAIALTLGLVAGIPLSFLAAVTVMLLRAAQSQANR